MGIVFLLPVHFTTEISQLLRLSKLKTKSFRVIDYCSFQILQVKFQVRLFTESRPLIYEVR